jgi:hypothetical protein
MISVRMAHENMADNSALRQRRKHLLQMPLIIRAGINHRDRPGAKYICIRPPIGHWRGVRCDHADQILAQSRDSLRS